MRNAFTFTAKWSAVCIGSALLAQTAVASGYHFGTQSVSSQSTANASAAEAESPATIFYNPAGLVYLPGFQFSGNLNLIAPSVKYSNAKGYYPTAPRTIQGESSGKITKSLIAVPHMYASYQINDRWTAGLGIYVPFASETEYSENSVLRYNVNQTKLTSFDINPTIAFKINQRHAVGVGLIAQYSSAELRQYANWGGLFGANGKLDGVANVSGSDWGFGYNVGWLWDVSDNVRVGANYRSKISHKLKGTAEWTVADGVNPALAAAALPTIRRMGYAAREDSTLDIVTPESLSLHGMWKVNPQWNLFGDVTWTRHSRFNTLNLQYANTKTVANGNPPPRTAQSNATIMKPNWRDTFKVALGASYQLSQPLQLRFGMAYDQSPVRDADSRMTTMPDNDRIWLSGGLKYDLSKNSSINAGYSYVHVKSASANVNGWCGSTAASGAGAANCVSSRTNGSADFKSRVHIVGLAYNYRF